MGNINIGDSTPGDYTLGRDSIRQALGRSTYWVEYQQSWGLGRYSGGGTPWVGLRCGVLRTRFVIRGLG